ncbi:MAG: mechanosensitive ion channel [Ruminococcus sp.]|nr:mechanosensitive ion channel [Oscillospiraceae bacterium]MBR2724769.1 mechanosensitive ion channel [Ruminococcus sp.]
MDWEKLLQYILEFATSWGIKLLAAIVIFIVGLKLIKFFKKWLKNSPKLDKLDASLRSFLASFTNILLYIILIITIASILGIPATSFITILASCGVAIGLALQGALSNFAGGIMLLLFKPFKVGDYVEVSGESGTVLEISVVYTVILTVDNKRITVPNGTLTNSVIKNYSAEKLRRVDMTFSTAYDCDIEKTKSIISRIIEKHPLTLSDPAPLVRLTEHADSSLTYTARAWCKNENYWDVKFDITEQVKKEFDKEGIEIPYPQMDVHVKNN